MSQISFNDILLAANILIPWFFIPWMIKEVFKTRDNLRMMKACIEDYHRVLKELEKR